MTIKINHEQLKKQIKLCYNKKLPLFIWGTMGIGKSASVKSVAEEISKSLNLGFIEGEPDGEEKFGFIDIRVSQLEPSDLRGIPTIKEGFTKWITPNWLPSNEKSKGILFLDEINLAPSSIQASCFLGDTLVGGENYKEIKNLVVGDKVIDKNGEMKKVTELKSRFYDEKLYKIKGRNFMPIKATKEHPFLVIERYTKGNVKHNKNRFISSPKWITAQDLRKGMYIGIPILKANREDKEIIIKKDGQIVRQITLNEKLARLIGYYVGDGYYSRGRIGICLNKTEKEYQKEVSELFEEIFGKESWKRNDKGNCIDMGICDTQIGEKLKEICGENVYKKKIPNCILFNKNREILRSFLMGYFRADGHVYNEKNSKGFIGLTTTSKVLALQLQQAFTRFGILFSIYTQKPNTRLIRGKVVNCAEAYRIQSSQQKAFAILELNKINKVNRVTEHFFEHDEKLWARIDNIDMESYSGLVYNCEVEDTHSYLANNYIVHNCYQLILDRRIGDYKLPEGWVVVSAGNTSEDKANVYDMPMPLCNRYTHVELSIPTKEEWVNWALKNGIDTEICMYIESHPSALYRFERNAKSKAFPTPRSWAFTSTLIKDSELNLEDKEVCVSSCVGEGTAHEFMAFCRLKNKININDILKNPKLAEEVKDVDLKYSLITALAEKYREDKKSIPKILEVSEHIETEFAMLLLRLMKAINSSYFEKEIVKLPIWKDNLSKKYVRLLTT